MKEKLKKIDLSNASALIVLIVLCIAPDYRRAGVRFGSKPH